MATSLVTGGAGFMGSHVTEHLIRMGHEVVVLDDLSGGFEENVPKGATFIRGSIVDHELINRLFDRHAFTNVYHLAAYAAEGLSHFIKRFNYTNNLIGSVNLINASINHDVKCFVFTSSIAVYGAGQSPMSEDMIPHRRPLSKRCWNFHESIAARGKHDYLWRWNPAARLHAH